MEEHRRTGRETADRNTAAHMSTADTAVHADGRNRQDLLSALEGILFASGEPVHVDRLCTALSLERAEAEQLLKELGDGYAYERRGVRLLKLENSYQLCSSPDHADTIRKAFEIRKPAKLSPPALEALTIIAYYQPTTRAFVDKLRGVDSGYTVNLLLERGLIESCGKLNVPGRPFLYRTTQQFLRAFHLSTLDDLPPLPEGVMPPREEAVAEGTGNADAADDAAATGTDNGKNPDTAAASDNGQSTEAAGSDDAKGGDTAVHTKHTANTDTPANPDTAADETDAPPSSHVIPPELRGTPREWTEPSPEDMTDWMPEEDPNPAEPDADLAEPDAAVAMGVSGTISRVTEIPDTVEPMETAGTEPPSDPPLRAVRKRPASRRLIRKRQKKQRIPYARRAGRARRRLKWKRRVLRRGWIRRHRSQRRNTAAADSLSQSGTVDWGHAKPRKRPVSRRLVRKRRRKQRIPYARRAGRARRRLKEKRRILRHGWIRRHRIPHRDKARRTDENFSLSGNPTVQTAKTVRETAFQPVADGSESVSVAAAGFSMEGSVSGSDTEWSAAGSGSIRRIRLLRTAGRVWRCVFFGCWLAWPWR